ncbi:type II toxin-antitoxin system RelE/ParE family toxin [Mesonia sp.]|uniref:type II toxin-antitoxin system RelE/ParE family toxin n=1 Tax=Mesonia sp. TaxID=1960830 RepID=UPI003F9896F4
MAKQVIWSLRAQNDRKKILRYWKNRNKSNEFSKKLNGLFKEAIKLIADYSEIGKPTDDKNARIKIVRDYLIIYQIKKEQIIILTIWDSRQSPEKLKSILK